MEIEEVVYRHRRMGVKRDSSAEVVANAKVAILRAPAGAGTLRMTTDLIVRADLNSGLRVAEESRQACRRYEEKRKTMASGTSRDECRRCHMNYRWPPEVASVKFK